MSKNYKPGEFGKIIGVSVRTLQNWDNTGKLIAYRSPTNQRFYTEEQLQQILGIEPETIKRKTVGYCRVSTPGQKESLKTQEEYMRSYTNAKGVILDEIISDIGSGINYNRKNWNKLLLEVESGSISQIYVTYKDRFTRFGFEWFEEFCKRHDTEIIVLNQPSTSPEQELAEDLLNIVTVFSDRNNGLRKYKLELENENNNSQTQRSKLL